MWVQRSPGLPFPGGPTLDRGSRPWTGRPAEQVDEGRGARGRDNRLSVYILPFPQNYFWKFTTLSLDNRLKRATMASPTVARLDE